MAHGHAGLGAEAHDKPLQGHEILHAVVDEIDLAAAREFFLDGIADDVLREGVRLGDDGLAVGRRSGDDRQVARPHERELQRTRDGGGREGQGVDAHAELRQLLLGGHAELLFLVDDQKAQVAESDLLAQHLVGADEYVDLARSQFLADLAGLFGRFRAVEILHPHGEVAQTLHERAVVLQGENRGGNQHRHLLAVDGGLECGTYGDLGLTEAHVAAHQTVHRLLRLHIPLHGLDGTLLVGCFLPAERSLHLLLQVAVGRESEALARLALGVEGDKLARDILDGLFRGAFQLLPCAVAQLVDLGGLALAALVARDAVERMDVHEQNVVILVDQLDGLVHLAVLVDLHQTAEAAHAVVDMHHVVAHLQGVELRDGHLLVALDLAVDAIAAVAVEDLVVGIEACLRGMVDEAFVQGHRHRIELDPAAPHLAEYVVEALDLRLALREDVGPIPLERRIGHVVGQHLELLVELGLRRGAELHFGIGRALAEVVVQHIDAPPLHVAQQTVAAGEHGIDQRRLLHLAQHAAAQVVHAAQSVVGIVEPVDGVAEESRHRNLVFGADIQVGDDLHAFGLVVRQLARYVETADGVDLVAEEIDAERTALGIGEHIDYAAAQRVLPGFVDEIDLHEPTFDEALLQIVDAHTIAHAQADAPLAEGTLIGHALGQSIGIGAHHQIAVVHVADGVHGVGALHHTLRVLLAVEDRFLVRGGEEMHTFLVQKGVEVVEQVGRGIAVLGNEQVDAALAAYECGGIERKSPADQIFEMDGSALLIVLVEQESERLRRLDLKQNIVYTLQSQRDRNK